MKNRTVDPAGGVRNRCLALCIFLVAWLCISQIIGNSILLLLCLACFLAFVIWSCEQGLVFPILLFFLPWSALLKYNIESSSFYTLALLFSSLYLCFRRGVSLRIYFLILALIIMITSLVAKLANGYSIDAGFIVFIFLLAFFPVVLSDGLERVDFYWLTVFFAVGVISAAISAQYLITYRNIAKYIEVDQWSEVTRLSGYYSDPNMYATHISACLSGMLLLLLKERKTLRIVFLSVCVLVLIYCGFLSASKTFVILTVATVVVWFILVLRLRNGGWKKVFLFAVLAAFTIFVLTSSLFQSLLSVYRVRFSYRANVSDLTTGRTDLWEMYCKELLSNLKLFLLGHGFTNVKLNARASHSTLLQTVYQFGVFGGAALVAWFCGYVKHILSLRPREKTRVGFALVLCLGTLAPWFVLDMLFRDEFFLIPLYVFFGIACFCAEKDTAAEEE